MFGCVSWAPNFSPLELISSFQYMLIYFVHVKYSIHCSLGKANLHIWEVTPARAKRSPLHSAEMPTNALNAQAVSGNQTSVRGHEMLPRFASDRCKNLPRLACFHKPSGQFSASPFHQEGKSHDGKMGRCNFLGLFVSVIISLTRSLLLELSHQLFWDEVALKWERFSPKI